MSKTKHFLAAALAVAIYSMPTLVTKAQAIPAPTLTPQVSSSAAESTNNKALSTKSISLPVTQTLHIKVTAYTSEADQTDDTPFITANGTYVHDGIVATNLLPFGTRVQIPALFGDKIFTVEDRMAKRFSNNIDVWMANKATAIVFGARMADIVVLGTAPAAITANPDLSLNSAASK